MLRASAAWFKRPRVILATGWLVALLYGYPGRVTWDSLEMLKGVREGGTLDSHAPLLEWMWRVLELVVAGPIGWFAVQVLAFSLGCFSILRRRMSPTWAAAAATALLLFPPILAPLAVVWRQSMMMALLVAGTAGLLSERRARKLAGLGALLLACSAREAAIIAALPIVLLFTWSPQHRPLRRYALAFATWVGLALLAHGANYALVEQETNHEAMSLAPFDIAGVVVRIDATDAQLLEMLEGSGLRTHTKLKQVMRKGYQPQGVGPLISGPNAPWHMPLVSGHGIDDDQAHLLRSARSALIRAHLRAYVIHRYAVAKELLALGRKPQQPLAALAVLPVEVALVRGIPTRGSETRDLLVSIVESVSLTPLFSPWVYALLALLLIPFARRDRVVLALLASGLLAEIYAFIWATGYDYRWSQWLIAATCIGLVATIAARAQRPRDA